MVVEVSEFGESDGGPAALTDWLPWLLVRYPLVAP